MDFISTYEGTPAADFYPKGWDFRRIDRITSLGRDEFDRRQPFWHSNFHPEACTDAFGGYETMNVRMGFEMYELVRRSAEQGRQLALIVPVGPMGMYRWAVYFSRRSALSWAHVHTFNMDEWADADGNTMPHGSGRSFQEIMTTHLFGPLGELTVPERQRHFATKLELPLYGERIRAIRGSGGRLGLVYGVGRSCHVAFWEPTLAAEYRDADEWRGQTHRIGLAIHPLSIEQNSLHSYASRMTLVPARANTIGPGLFLEAEWCIGGADGAHGALDWQGQPIWMTLRYGPDPWVPSSFMPTLPGVLFVIEKLAGPLVPDPN